MEGPILQWQLQALMVGSERVGERLEDLEVEVSYQGQLPPGVWALLQSMHTFAEDTPTTHMADS